MKDKRDYKRLFPYSNKLMSAATAILENGMNRNTVNNLVRAITDYNKASSNLKLEEENDK